MAERAALESGRARPAIGGRLALFSALLAAMAVASCYSSNDRREARASVALISGLSSKLADYCRAGFTLGGRPVTAEEMGEFYYGLEKARAFERMAADAAPKPWHQPLKRMNDAYEAFLSAADQYRLSSARAPEKLAALLGGYELVRRRVAVVTRTLDGTSLPP